MFCLPFDYIQLLQDKDDRKCGKRMREDFIFIYFMENSGLEPWGDSFRKKTTK